MDKFRDRLTANANDFDGIVSDMLAHIDQLNAQLAERDAQLAAIKSAEPVAWFDRESKEGVLFTRARQNHQTAVPKNAGCRPQATAQACYRLPLRQEALANMQRVRGADRPALLQIRRAILLMQTLQGRNPYRVYRQRFSQGPHKA